MNEQSATPAVERMANVFPNAPNTAAVEDGNRHDRARLGYFANKALVDDILSNTANDLLLTTSVTVIVRSIFAFNNAGGATTLYVKFVPPGVAAAAWLPFLEISLATKETKSWIELDNVLETGTQICAWGSTGNDILLKINGVNTVGQ